MTTNVYGFHQWGLLTELDREPTHSPSWECKCEVCMDTLETLNESRSNEPTDPEARPSTARLSQPPEGASPFWLLIIPVTLVGSAMISALLLP